MQDTKFNPVKYICTLKKHVYKFSDRLCYLLLSIKYKYFDFTLVFNLGRLSKYAQDTI